MKRKRDTYESQSKKKPKEKGKKDKSFSDELREKSEKELGKLENLYIEQQNEERNEEKDGNIEDENDSDSSDSIYLSEDYVVPAGELEKLGNDFVEEEEDEEDVIISPPLPTAGTQGSEGKKKKKKKPRKKSKPSALRFHDPFDEEDGDEIVNSRTNTVGSVPLEWYDEYPHLGYDSSGEPVLRKRSGDRLDELVRQTDDPHYLQTVTDEFNDQEIRVSGKALKNIINIQHRREFPEDYEQYRPYYIIAEHDSRFPLRRNQPSKRKTLIVDLDERKKIRQLKNKIEHHKYIPSYRREHKKESEYYHMWNKKGQVIGGQGRHPGGHLPPPKEKTPGNRASYRPPPEYMNDEEEEEGKDRLDKMYRIPQPPDFVDDRLERCLELYLCTREKVKRYRKEVPPESLFPSHLPHPKDLRPYPEIQSVIYEGHGDIVRTISCDPTGQWLASGDEGGEVRLWEVETGRCLRVWKFAQPVVWVAWNPNPEIHLLAVAVDQLVVLICPPNTGTQRVRQNTLDLFPVVDDTSKVSINPSTIFEEEDMEEENVEERIHEERVRKEKEEIGEMDDDDEMEMKDQKSVDRRGKKQLVLQWKFPRGMGTREGIPRGTGIMAQIVHRQDVTHISWHYKGDYFSTLADPYIFVHQLSSRKSQKPFRTRDRKRGGKYQRTFFHPKLPFFYVVTQRKIKVYNLQKQKLRKILTKHRCRYISDVDIYPKNGEHLIIGGYDKRLEWFEVEIASRPCKSMKFHKEAVRAVKYHKRYPIFASCSDDAKIHLFHCKVYEDDWVKDPLIVPLKVLKGHQKHKQLGVMDIEFHPFQPWLFSAGSDHTIRLYTS